MTKNTILILLAAVLTLNIASAIVINSVDVAPLSPGEEGTIRIEVENILDRDVKDISLTLNFQNLPFIPIGTSEQSVDEIEEDKDEDFIFRIKASPTAVPGDYQIPYTLEYELNSQLKKRTGAIGVKVTSNPILSYSINTNNPVVGQQATLTLRIVNKGFSDARFVSIKVLPEEFTLLSDSEVYIGEIESDDFETAVFDVIFTKTNPKFTAVVEYINFENSKIIETADLPLTIYSKEKAIELGIIKKDMTLVYVSTVIALILLILLWRTVRRRRRLKRSQRLQETG